jgi:KDO2-lipid IV(A) lauroyltransferase
MGVCIAGSRWNVTQGFVLDRGGDWTNAASSLFMLLSMASGLKNLRYRGERLALEAALRVVPHLGRRTAARFARVIGSAYYRLDPRGRKVAEANLKAAFAGRFDVEERGRIARASMQSFARTFVDLFWSSRLARENWQEYILATGTEHLSARGRDGSGTIFVVQHYGNWEWLSFYSNYEGRESRVVAQEFKNPHIGPAFDRVRARSGNEIIGRKGAMLRVAKYLRQGGAVAVLTDLTVPPADASVVIDCFGLKTCVSAMVPAFYRRLGCALVPAVGEHLPDGRCAVTISSPLNVPAGASDRAIAQMCWDHFEARLREKPEQWLWSYKHWRYLPEGADPASYPFYANRSKAFDRKLRSELS